MKYLKTYEAKSQLDYLDYIFDEIKDVISPTLNETTEDIAKWEFEKRQITDDDSAHLMFHLLFDDPDPDVEYLDEDGIYVRTSQLDKVGLSEYLNKKIKPLIKEIGYFKDVFFRDDIFPIISIYCVFSDKFIKEHKRTSNVGLWGMKGGKE